MNSKMGVMPDLGTLERARLFVCGDDDDADADSDDDGGVRRHLTNMLHLNNKRLPKHSVLVVIVASAFDCATMKCGNRTMELFAIVYVAHSFALPVGGLATSGRG